VNNSIAATLTLSLAMADRAAAGDAIDREAAASLAHLIRRDFRAAGRDPIEMLAMARGIVDKLAAEAEAAP
jgi:hypothetical protein